jgi:transcriptional regulator with XRE-family HTH domain
MHIGQRLRKRREQLGLSQWELARRTGIPQSTISDLERGVQADMTTTLVKRFAQALACTTDYLIGMYEDEEGHLEPAGVALVGA